MHSPVRVPAKFRVEVAALLVTLAMALVAGAACSGDTVAAEPDPPRFGIDALSEGVAVEVGGKEGVVESAEVFVPDDRPWFDAWANQPGADRPNVLQPADDRFDAVVIYTAGPYCGLLPEVTIRETGSGLTATVYSQYDDGCDAVEYVEAVGFTFSDPNEARPLKFNNTRR